MRVRDGGARRHFVRGGNICAGGQFAKFQSLSLIGAVAMGTGVMIGAGIFRQRRPLDEATFGKVWTVRMILAIIVMGLIWSGLGSPPDSRRGLFVVGLAAALLVTLAGVRHS